MNLALFWEERLPSVTILGCKGKYNKVKLQTKSISFCNQNVS